MQAALAAILLLLSSLALGHSSPARAATVSRAVTATRAAVAAATRIRMGAWYWALKQRGKPYIWGGTGPAGFDCSGLVFAAYRAKGIALPRTTYGMLASRMLIRIPKSEAKRGDLAFFGSGHVELYDWGPWTYGAADSGTRIGYHRMNAYWHPTMYFKVRD